jgi:hypothetical protein
MELVTATEVSSYFAIFCRQWMRREPQCTRARGWIQTHICPPLCLVTVAVDLTMVPATQGDRELIADLSAEGTGLSKPKMMSIGGLSSAD